MAHVPRASSTQWQCELPGDWWDQQLFARGGHFLQSTHWGAFNQSLDRHVFFGSGAGWQCLAILERSRAATRLYCPYGPVADDPDAYAMAVAAIVGLGRRRNAVFVRLEPWAPVEPPDLQALKHHRAFKTVQPALTWVQNLRKSPDELFAEFSANNRNRYRNAHKKGLTFAASTDPADVAILVEMLQDVAQHTGIRPHSEHYYRNQAKVLLQRRAGVIYIARHQGRPVAASIAFDSPTTRYYAHSGSLFSARSLHAGAPLLATMILDAQRQGQSTFDFVGAAPPDEPDHRWAGFTAFKQSFGGTYRRHLGTWDVPCSPFYRVYRSAYRLAEKKSART